MSRDDSVEPRGPGAHRHVRASFVALATLTITGCVTNHDLLAAPDGTGGSGGTSSGNGSGGAIPSEGGRDAQVDAALAAPDGEVVSPGARTLTLLHGVIDSPWIGFCFAIVRGGQPSPVSGAITPPGGLAFGRSASLESIPGVALGTDDLLPYLVAAASADVVSGMDCAAIVSRAKLGAPPSVADASPEAASPPSDATARVDASFEPPDGALGDASTSLDAGARDSGTSASVPIPAVRVAALPILPAVAVTAAKSYLLVAGGCMGGPGVTDPSERSICGATYSPATPTLVETVVELSRAVPAARIGLAFLDGTPALRSVDLELVPETGEPVTVASSVVSGALRPFPPTVAFSTGDIAANAPASSIQLSADGSPSPIYDQPWAPTLRAGALADLADGTGYTLVVIGPYPGFAKRNWWNESLVTIVKN